MNWNQRWNQEGGGREVLRLAVPLILSSSFLTLQIVVDRILLSKASSEAVAAAMPAVLLYWTPFNLLVNIANYATTFVAQYKGAGRPERIGPTVWQALYFSLVTGVVFMALAFVAGPLVAWGEHSPAVQELELSYFRCLCFAALPALIVASVNSFFAGRGDSWTVLIIDGIGLSANALLAYLLIFGKFGFPACGVVGAGIATVAGSTISAVIALALFLRPKFREEFRTLSGWRFDGRLFSRLMKFGFPNGMQWMLDALAFTIFVFLIGRLGDVELAASNIAFTINVVVLLPMLGMGQAVSVLVGQRLGQDRPDLAERSTWNGLWLAGVYICAAAALCVLIPETLVYPFHNDTDHNGPAIAKMVPVLLRFIAIYSAFDTLNIVFAFALRGAGDTKFVTIVSLAMAWPLMVLPTYLVVRYDASLYWAWGCASFYICALGITFLLRFRTGKWKSMRVIERTPILDEVAEDVDLIAV